MIEGWGTLGPSSIYVVSGSIIVPDRPIFVAGRWYAAALATIANPGPLGANVISLYPFYLSRAITISDLGCRVNILDVGKNCQLAIYGADANSLPTGLPLAATGNISVTAIGPQSADIIGPNVLLPIGLYWAAVCTDSAACSFQSACAIAFNLASFMVGSTSLATAVSGASSGEWHLTIAQAFGAWPDLTGAAFTESIGTAFSAATYLKAA